MPEEKASHAFVKMRDLAGLFMDQIQSDDDFAVVIVLHQFSEEATQCMSAGVDPGDIPAILRRATHSVDKGVTLTTPPAPQTKQ